MPHARQERRVGAGGCFSAAGWRGADDRADRVWLTSGVTVMRRGMNTLTLQVQGDLGRVPHAGDLYIFRGCRGDLLKFSVMTGGGGRSTPSA